MAGKQDHLLAGKKKLEEFRKKKAAEKAKKTTSSSQIRPPGAGQPETQVPQSDSVRVNDFDGAGTSDGNGGASIDTSSLITNNDLETAVFVNKADVGSSDDTHARPLFSANNISSTDSSRIRTEVDKFADVSTEPANLYASLKDKGVNNNYIINSGTSAKREDGITREQINSFYQPSFQDSDSSFGKYNNYGLGESLSRDGGSRFKDVADANTSFLSDRLGSFSLRNTSVYNDMQSNDPRSASYGDSLYQSSNVTEAPSGQNGDTVIGHKNNSIAYTDERNYSRSVGHLTSANSASLLSTGSRSTGVGLDPGSSSNHATLSPAVVGTSARRSRPSFLDSINTSRASSTSLPQTEQQTVDSFNSKVYPMDILASSATQDSANTFTSSNGYDLFRHDRHEQNVESKHTFYSAKQNEDFAALEQHIEDLTQEKFSLQRALEASRTLAESLASENSALTDSYNQQGSVVNQLKSDMEKLQQEIKAHLVELEALKGEYTNAQLECNASDERAKLLASEVIGLEEKALRLRSSELKLERQLENSQAEMSSFRKKITSLEKERQDLQLTIDALQEEKKLLQSKLRKASASGKFIDVSKSPSPYKKDVSTSTEDLVDVDIDAPPETTNHEINSAALLNESDASAEVRQNSLQGLSLGIPPDQSRMIQNINTLISELSLEKEELIHALSAESSQSSKLKVLNKELSRKLEIQTQRLELLTAQSMANDNIPARQPDSHTIPNNTQYADEGDEVVERVLGWILKLFPGGPSKRRTSKLL